MHLVNILIPIYVPMSVFVCDRKSNNIFADEQEDGGGTSFLRTSFLVFILPPFYFSISYQASPHSERDEKRVQESVHILGK